METKQIIEKTEALIDALRAQRGTVTSAPLDLTRGWYNNSSLNDNNKKKCRL